MKPQVEWYVKPSKWRRDPSFYVSAGDSGSTTVAKVTLNGRSVYVSCDGITSVSLLNAAGDTVDVLRYGEDFIHAGIKSDKKLTSMSSRLWWDNNSWFDLYDETGDHIDEVSYDIYEAVADAIRYLEEESAMKS